MEPLEQVASDLTLTADEYSTTTNLLNAAKLLAQEAGFVLDGPAQLGLVVHLASLIRRLAKGELILGIDTAVLNEVPRDCMDMAARLLQPLYDKTNQLVDPTEVGLVALHFAAARERVS